MPVCFAGILLAFCRFDFGLLPPAAPACARVSSTGSQTEAAGSAHHPVGLTDQAAGPDVFTASHLAGRPFSIGVPIFLR